MYGIMVLLVRLDELLVYCTLPHRYLVILAGFPQLSSFLVENECSLLLGGVRCASQKKICEKKKKKSLMLARCVELYFSCASPTESSAAR